MELNLKQLKDRALEEIKKITLAARSGSATAAQLQILEAKYLGRKGELAQVLKKIKEVAAAEKPKLGLLANEVKTEIEGLFFNLKAEFKETVAETSHQPWLDVTLPGLKKPVGHLHPLTQVQQELEETFKQMGFITVDGPEVESEFYNFEVLNMPASHPARDLQDTFYLKDHSDLVMRTQTSNQQVRALEQYGSPLRAIFSGRVFRFEATDASHDTTFYQLEGLMVDKNISITNLLAVLQVMLKAIFKREIKMRVRPSYFPFVEPGLEVDAVCAICDGQGCSVCKQTGWVEILGSGLVHPKVLQSAGLDPKEYSGFAFGLGVTRLVMMKYGIPDIRLLLGGDLRFLEQF